MDLFNPAVFGDALRLGLVRLLDQPINASSRASGYENRLFDDLDRGNADLTTTGKRDQLFFCSCDGLKSLLTDSLASPAIF